MRAVLQQYQISPSRIYNTDEVGLLLSDMNLHFASTRENIQGDLSNDHVTALLTTCADGTPYPPYLLFPGTDTSVIPNIVQENKKLIWANFSEAGWMDETRFQVFILMFLQELKERSKQSDLLLPLSEFHLLLVDGHNSRLNSSTLFTCMMNCLIVFCGPSNLTQAWQANDAGVNKAFKDNMERAISHHVEAHQRFSSSDIVSFTLKAWSQENIVRSIRNSFRHVGIEPFDDSRMFTMIEQEKPKEELLQSNLVLQTAVLMAKDHLDTLENLTKEKRKRDETESEK